LELVQGRAPVRQTGRPTERVQVPAMVLAQVREPELALRQMDQPVRVQGLGPAELQGPVPRRTGRQPEQERVPQAREPVLGPAIHQTDRPEPGRVLVVPEWEPVQAQGPELRRKDRQVPELALVPVREPELLPVHRQMDPLEQVQVLVREQVLPQTDRPEPVQELVQELQPAREPELPPALHQTDQRVPEQVRVLERAQLPVPHQTDLPERALAQVLPRTDRSGRARGVEQGPVLEPVRGVVLAQPVQAAERQRHRTGRRHPLPARPGRRVHCASDRAALRSQRSASFRFAKHRGSTGHCEPPGGPSAGWSRSSGGRSLESVRANGQLETARCRWLPTEPRSENLLSLRRDGPGANTRGRGNSRHADRGCRHRWLPKAFPARHDSCARSRHGRLVHTSLPAGCPDPNLPGRQTPARQGRGNQVRTSWPCTTLPADRETVCGESRMRGKPRCSPHRAAGARGRGGRI
jgi:hypothetical protein